MIANTKSHWIRKKQQMKPKTTFKDQNEKRLSSLKRHKNHLRSMEHLCGKTQTTISFLTVHKITLAPYLDWHRKMRKAISC